MAGKQGKDFECYLAAVAQIRILCSLTPLLDTLSVCRRRCICINIYYIWEFLKIYNVYHPSCTYCASQSQLLPLLFPVWTVLSLICAVTGTKYAYHRHHFSLILIRFVRLCVVAARKKGYFLNIRWLLRLHIITAAESWCSDQGKMS